MAEQDFEKIQHDIDELALLHLIANFWEIEEIQREQEKEDIALRARASEEMGCTCDACLNIIRKEIEDEAKL